MEVLLAVLMFGAAIAAGALVISSIEKDKPWAHDLARAYAVLSRDPGILAQPTQRAELHTLRGDDTESEAAEEQPRLVA